MLDFASLKLPRSPNSYLLAPAGLCRNTTPHGRAPVFKAPPVAVRDALLAVAAGEPRATVLERDDQGFAYELVQKSAVFKFPDLISVRLIADGAGAALAIYSRAKLGYRDFGVNRARVSRWVGAIQAKLG
ncbi:MAG: DUF1499 domain-containing protein [Caulobacterales bacterium]